LKMSRAAYATRLTSCHPCQVRFCGHRLRVSACLLEILTKARERSADMVAWKDYRLGDVVLLNVRTGRDGVTRHAVSGDSRG
jgi:hypothetical protein